MPDWLAALRQRHLLLDPYYALENVGYSMLTNFDAGVPYVHSSVRDLFWCPPGLELPWL